jgi:hypothetical protein
MYGRDESKQGQLTRYSQDGVLFGWTRSRYVFRAASCLDLGYVSPEMEVTRNVC